MLPRSEAKSAPRYFVSDDGTKVRIHFPSRPDPLIRQNLRAMRWKWCPEHRWWEAPKTPRNEMLAKEFADMSDF